MLLEWAWCCCYHQHLPSHCNWKAGVQALVSQAWVQFWASYFGSVTLGRSARFSFSEAEIIDTPKSWKWKGICM